MNFELFKQYNLGDIVTKKIFNGFSGVYCIKNTINGKFYIGRTLSLYNRLNQHKTACRKKNPTKTSKHLIRAVQKYGMEKFVFFILHASPNRFDYVKEEQFYLDTFRPWDHSVGYNDAKTADFYNCRLGTNISENHKQKIRSAVQKYKGTYTLISPEDKKVIVKDIYSFCIEKGLWRADIIKVLNEKKVNFLGWRLYKNKHIPPFAIFKFLHIESGEIREFKAGSNEIAEFYKTINANQSLLKKHMNKGVSRGVRGWRRVQ